MGRVATPIRVLHVDDEPAFAELAAECLEQEDPRLSVVTATSAEAALERLGDGAFDCVVSDFDMPGLDGIAFLEAVREAHPDLPFVLFTGKGSEEVASDAISAGVTDYLQKDPGTEQFAILANRLGNLVEGHRSHRALAERRRVLETLIDNLPGMVYRCRNEPTWPMTYVEGECEAITGYEPAAFVDGEVTYGGDVIHPDDRDDVWESVQAALEAGEAFELTYRLVTADGEVTWVWERGRGVDGDDGELEALEGFVTDVSDERARERAIEELHATTRELMGATTPAVVADVVVEAMRDILRLPANSVHLHDPATGRLEPVAWTEACEALVGEPPGFGPEEGLAWAVYASGESRLFDDVSTVDGRLNETTAIRSEIILPLGEHGVVLLCSGERDAFDDTDVSLARTLAFHATEALDRLAHEQEIARQRSLLAAQQEAVLDGILVVDDEGQIVSYNDRLLELWGVPEELVAVGDEAPALDWVTDVLADPEAFHERVQELYEHPERTARDEVELADGRVFDRYTTPLVGDDGTSFGRLWTFRDVTERETRERRLEALQALSQSLMHTTTVEETAQVAIESARDDLGAQLSGVYTRSDDGERLEPTAVLDRFVEEKGEQPVYVRGDDDPTHRVVWRAFESGEPLVLDDIREHDELAEATPARSAIIHPLGDTGVFIVSSTEPQAFDDADRALVEILATSLAVALDRVERERELEAERDRLSALFEMVPDPIVEVRFEDGEPLVVAVNSAFERTFGPDADDVVGRSVNEVLVPEDREEEAATIDDLVRGDGAVSREVRRRTADGVGDFLFRSVPVGEAGATDEYYGVYVDVSEQKTVERQLERQNERLEEFASVVSHDLRNPLNVAQGYLDLLEGGDPEAVEAIGRAHDRMEALIDDLLVVARDGAQAQELEDVRLGPMAADCWENVATGDAELRTEADATIRADPGRLAQLLENLFRNAVEHGSTGPRTASGGDAAEGDSAPSKGAADAPDGRGVTVVVEALPDGFAVEDDGPGIPEDERERVFELGYSTDPEGTGFGLSIVRQVAESHGWSTRVTEGAAGGARIEVTGVAFVEP